MKRNLVILVGGFSIAVILMSTAIIVLFSPSRSDIITDYPAPVLGVVVDGNKTVVHVEPGSAAEKAGIQVGDVLTEVNNASVVKSSEAAKGEVHSALNGKAIHIKLRRNNNDMEVDASPAPPKPRPNLATPTPVLPPNDYY